MKNFVETKYRKKSDVGERGLVRMIKTKEVAGESEEANEINRVFLYYGNINSTQKIG